MTFSLCEESLLMLGSTQPSTPRYHGIDMHSSNITPHYQASMDNHSLKRHYTSDQTMCLTAIMEVVVICVYSSKAEGDELPSNFELKDCATSQQKWDPPM